MSSHSERMKQHLIGQFWDKRVLAAELEALGEELDELAQVFDDLKSKRWIDTGEGEQLDGIGRLINQPRQIADAVQLSFFGFFGQENAQGFEVGRFRDDWEIWLASVNLNDEQYRKILWLKVFKDISHGTAEDTIASTKRIFNAPYVSLAEVGNAKIFIGIGRILTDSEIHLVKAVDLIVRAAGVGVQGMSHFDYDNYFGFLGQPNAKSFDVGFFADDIQVIL